ncbi:hypothetical protein ACP275_14G234400 [Erythranthe tilingii]
MEGGYKGRRRLPEFGGWDRKSRDETNYSVVFSEARAQRKMRKTEHNRDSLGNEREFLKNHPHLNPRRHDFYSALQRKKEKEKKKKTVTCLSCFFRV